MFVSVVAYLLAHFLLYAFVVRHVRWFHREAAILLFHAVPAAMVAAWVFGSLLVEPTMGHLSEAAAALSLQGLYSLSFLELWSLTQGGYSLHILSRFCASGGTATAADLAFLKGVGAAKRTERLSALLRLGLIAVESDRVRLTRRGRAVALGLRCVAWAVNHKHLG